MARHDKDSTQAITYLGYPIYTNKLQLDLFLDTIHSKIIKHIQYIKARSLSIVGRYLVANSLILSRLWYILRVLPAKENRLKKIKRIVNNFVASITPKQ
ncbi:hypothetical protein BJ944DRAFT_163608 [Cunninghamella echinulata]|nr:hypothetical protein BJ944DRAFT_163608 [Cunninghamella echinulata]